MPPDYGTPLTSLELIALKKYLGDNGIDTTISTSIPDPGTSTGGTSTTELSSLYKDKCVSCHGSAGEGVTGLGKKLAATSLSEAQFVKKVRDGVPGTTMGDYTETEAPEASLKADYAVLKALK
jgi:mono/diheme cytochrome c family protein